MEVPPATEKTLADKGTLTEPIICTLCNRSSPQADEEHQEPLTDGIDNNNGGNEISNQKQENLKRSTSSELLEPLKKPKIEPQDSRDPNEYPIQTQSRRKNNQPKKIVFDNQSEEPENPKPTCLLCELKFEDHDSYEKHLHENHDLETKEIFGPSTIKIDSNAFAEMLALERKFIEIDTSCPPNTCQLCLREFSDKINLRLHLRASHPKHASLACGICLQLTYSYEELQMHISTKHCPSKLTLLEIRRYYCGICWQQYDSKKKLYNHVFVHEFMVDAYKAAGVEFAPDGFIKVNNFGEVEENMNSMKYETENIDDGGYNGNLFGHFMDDHMEEDIEEVSMNDELDDYNDTLNEENGNFDENDLEVTGTQKASRNYTLRYGCEWCSRTFSSKWDRWLHVALEHAPDMEFLRCTIPNCEKIFATEAFRLEHEQHHQIQPEIPNSCEVCCKLWNNRVDFYKHMMGVHPQAVPLVCGVCLKIFPTVNELYHHVQNHSPLLGDFVCNICGRSYSNRSKMLRHKLIHGVDENGAELSGDIKIESDSEPEFWPMQDLKCKECPEVEFTSYDEFSTHKRVEHQTFYCDLCTKFYGRNSHLWKHVNRCHKGNKLITCQMCFKTSASKYHLKQHFNKIHALKNDKPRTRESLESGCSFESVKQSFRKQELLETNDEDFSGEPPKEIDVNSDLYTSIITNYNAPPSTGANKCIKCNKGFDTRFLLQKHKKNCRPRLQKDLLTRCKSCERIFKDRLSLQKHLANYHSEFKCHLCTIVFPSKCEIISHIRVTHPTHEDFVCECGQILRSKENLIEHRVDHLNSHICQFCGDCLLSKMKLKMHILSLHRKILSLSCGICLKLFATQYVLRDHVKLIHFRDTKFGNSCSVCGKKYASKWKCFDHINKSHGKVFKPCKICLSVFETEEEVRDHFCNVHIGTNNPKSETQTSTMFYNNLSLDYHPAETLTNPSSNPQQPLPDILPKNPPSPFFENSQSMPRLPLTQIKRTVYENSDAPSMCEICLKTWPAKKHLWQHYIRCHKLEAATICGICLKTHTNYSDLRTHLHQKHPTLLHGRGFSSNFICKICGRYHNASSKLKLHMLIHVNYNLTDDYEYVEDLKGPVEQSEPEELEVTVELPPYMTEDSIENEEELDDSKSINCASSDEGSEHVEVLEQNKVKSSPVSVKEGGCGEVPEAKPVKPEKIEAKQEKIQESSNVVVENSGFVAQGAFITEVQPVQPQYQEKSNSDFIVLKYDDGREVRYDNIQYQIDIDNHVDDDDDDKLEILNPDNLLYQQQAVMENALNSIIPQGREQYSYQGPGFCSGSLIGETVQIIDDNYERNQF